MALLCLVLLLVVALVASFQPSAAEIRVTDVRSDKRNIIPFDEFDFIHNSILELNISHISLSDPTSALDLSQLGFLLSPAMPMDEERCTEALESAVPRNGWGNNGFFSLRSLSNYIRIVSSGASAVAFTVDRQECLLPPPSRTVTMPDSIRYPGLDLTNQNVRTVPCSMSCC